MNKHEYLIDDVKHWFEQRNLDTAVVGFSGGIDSATTVALLDAAGIRTHIVLANAPGQRRESSYDPTYMVDQYKNVYCHILSFNMPTYGNDFFGESSMIDAAKEAALPILRNACFYAVAAEVREHGYKPVVVGTANFDEAAYLGFWGKASDAAQDLYPISHLHKSEVYELAAYLKVPKSIIHATPSGDLLWSGTQNDYLMIGATYDQIESLVKYVDQPKWRSMNGIMEFIENNVDDPKLFVKNIIKNAFKYQLPFPGFHVDKRLEYFRNNFYNAILVAATALDNEYAQA